MKRLAILIAFLALPVRAAIPDIASANTITLHGSGIYRVTGVTTIVNIAGLRDGDEIFLLPVGVFVIGSAGNIVPSTQITIAGKMMHFVMANGLVYETMDVDSTIYQLKSEKGAANGYLALDGGGKAVTTELGSGVADNTTYLRGDQTWASPAAGAGAPTNATYITETNDAILSNEFPLAALATGILKNTTATGVPSIAVAGDFPTLNQSTTGNAQTATSLAADPADCAANRYATTINASGTLTCAQVSLTAGVTGALPLANGGTDNSTAADDTTLVSNGAAWQTKALPACTAGKLLYDTATNAFSCGTDATGAPTAATYITQTPDATLSAEQALSALGTGLVKNTTGTGVLSIGVANTDYLPVASPSTTGAVTLTNQTAPSTPAAGKLGVWADSTAKTLVFTDDAGVHHARTGNASIAAQSPAAATDVYITNSDLIIPSFSMQAKTRFMWMISASKTAAGVAAPIYNIRIGTNKSTADTARLTLTAPAQTAIADIGTLYVMITVRSISATVGVIQGTAWWGHRGTAASSTVGTGFANDATGHVEGTSAGFANNALGGSSIGISVNTGTSAAWTITQVQASADW